MVYLIDIATIQIKYSRIKYNEKISFLAYNVNNYTSLRSFEIPFQIYDYD